MKTIYENDKEFLQDILNENYIPIMGVTIHSAKWHGTIYRKETSQNTYTYIFAGAYSGGFIIVTKYDNKQNALNKINRAMQYV